MGGGDWWPGWGGLAAEPASWREEGVANFPGEGALRARAGERAAAAESCDSRPAPRSALGAGKVTFFLYWLAFSHRHPLGLWEPRPTAPAPPLWVREAPRNTHTHTRTPAPPPGAQTRVGGGGGAQPGSGKSSQAGAEEGRGQAEAPEGALGSFHSALSLPGGVGPAPPESGAASRPRQPPGARAELSRPRPRQPDGREFARALDGAELGAARAARPSGDRWLLSSLATPAAGRHSRRRGPAARRHHVPGDSVLRAAASG